ncbi:PRA1 family protein E-like [Humulus lupulus]|uniref:PRA1 family protein E-like n=1 Tax=Humulus lupulus TaxID=3486 RepID=UPI002B40979D|nr:PRA1 family protein E-like [Humulus lupulus]
MSSSPPSNYYPTSPQGFSRSAPTYATRPPWRELVQPISALTCPHTFGEAATRINRNLKYFRVNYATAVLVILNLNLLWHPFSFTVFWVAFAWIALYFFRHGPIVVFNKTIDDRIVLVLLGVVTIVALVFTSVYLNELISVLIGAVLIGLHSAFRGIEYLHSDEQEAAEGELLSVVGSPPRTGV